MQIESYVLHENEVYVKSPNITRAARKLQNNKQWLGKWREFEYEKKFSWLVIASDTNDH